MEASRNQVNVSAESGNGDHRGSRVLRKRPKFSIVSARLDPNFDAKELALQTSSIQISATNKKTLNNEEVNPRTITFNELVTLLHPNFVTDYLQKVLHYLKSDNNELCFAGIGPLKEAFLVRIVENKSNLKCINVTEISRVVARQILEIVDAKQDVFTWTYKFVDGKVSKNILVYKKEYNKDVQNQATCRLKVPGTPNPSISNLTSSMEDMTIDKERQELPISFKTEALNTTLKFIKDSTRFSLQYPLMPVSHAEYIYSLLHAPVRKLDSVGFGFKSLDSSLVEAMKKYEAEFEFKVSFVDAYSDDMTQILLQKVPKVPLDTYSSSRQRSCSNTELNTSTESTESVSRKSRRQRKLEIIISLPEAFRLHVLTKWCDFVLDSAAVTLDFEVDDLQARFINFVPKQNSQSNAICHQFLSEECRELLRQIRVAKKRADWKLKKTVGKMNKITKLRNITFEKVPKYKAPAKNSSSSSSKNNKNTDAVSSEKSLLCPIGDMTTKPIVQERSQPVRPSSSQPISHSMSPKQSLQITFNVDSETKRSVNADARTTRPVVAFRSAGAKVLDAKEETDVTENYNHSTMNATPPPLSQNVVKMTLNCKSSTSRRSKLIAALSTPMESDKAERMMRMMGWEGGALGPRGEGIMEPIMPALHISPGAGLGHVKKNDQLTRGDFNLLFLNTALSLLRGGETETKLCTQEALSKKKKNFMNAALNAFNQRSKLAGNRKADITKLADDILTELTRFPDLMFDCEICEQTNEVKLFIEHGAPLPKSKKKRKKQGVSCDALAPPPLNIISEDDINSNVEMEASVQDAVSRRTAFRILFLKQIKQFLESDLLEKEYNFDCLLTKKHKSFIESVILHTNRKSKIKYLTDQENQLFEEIRHKAKDCHVMVETYVHKYTLHKKYYQKRFFNSALDLPPPKSKDISNTTIYIKGKQVDVDPNTGDICHEALRKGADSVSNDVASQRVTESNDDVIRVGNDTDDDNENVKCFSRNSVDSVTNVNNAVCVDWFDMDDENCIKNNDSVNHGNNFDDTSKCYRSVDDADGRDIYSSNTVNQNWDDEVINPFEDGIATKSNEDDDVIFVQEYNNTAMEISDDESKIEFDRNNMKSDLQVKVTTPSDEGLNYLNAIYCHWCNSDFCVTNESLEPKSENFKVKLEKHFDDHKLSNSKLDIKNLVDLNCDGTNSKYLSIAISNKSLLLDFDDCETSNTKQYDGKDVFIESKKELLNLRETPSLNIFNEGSADFNKVIKESELNNNICNKNICNPSVNSEKFDSDFNGLGVKRLTTNMDRFDLEQCELDEKVTLCITPKVVGGNISIETIQKLHAAIFDEIDKSDFLPHLECHGVMNDGLIYTCHDQKSSLWLKKLLQESTDLELKVIEIEFVEKVKHKLKMKINTLDSVPKVFDRLELYNKNLKTSDWVLNDVQVYRDFIVVYLEIDNYSYDYISKAGFALFAGVDKAKFSVVWD